VFRLVNALCNAWSVDGSFYVYPLLYTQLVAIHGITRDGWTFPLVCALLPDKKWESYQYVFEEIRNKTFLCPEIVLMDFEASSIKAMHNVYDSARLLGCHFHFTQALHRNMSSSMKKAFKDEGPLTLLIRKLFALPYAHPTDVLRSFNHIRCSVPSQYSQKTNPIMLLSSANGN